MVCIEDLLDREPIVLNDDAISHWVQDAVVMVTGAAGSIGSEIVRQLTHYNPSHLVLFPMKEISPTLCLQAFVNSLNKVDLPEPFCPRIVVIFLFGMVKDKSFIITSSVYPKVRFLIIYIYGILSWFKIFYFDVLKE